MLTEPSKIWWDEITGPLSLVRTMADKIQAAQSIYLVVPDDLPWRQQMRLSVERVLRSTDKELLIWCIDCQTDCQKFILPDGAVDVANYLLHERADPEIRSGYRKSSGITIQEYMLNNHVLKDRVVWVKGLDHKQMKSWLTFCEGYSAESQYDGLFVIESYEKSQSQVPCNMVTIEYLHYITRYDALLFNNMIVANLDMKEEWKSYIASLATAICNLDVELAEAFMSSTDFMSSEISESLSAISKSERFSKRYHAPHLHATHPFSLIRHNDIAEIEKRIWKAQLQVIYPLIEIERVAFVDRYKAEIKAGFSLEYSDKYERRHHIDQYGNELKDPYEAEVGTLYRMHKLHVAGEYGKFILPVPVESDRVRLELLHEMRNLLAHVSICSVDMINQFLSQYPFTW